MKKRQSFKERLVRPLTTGFMPLLGLMLPLLLCTNCKHVEGSYSSMKAPPIEKTASTNTFIVSRKLEPQWLKPSPDLFTLGPGDRLEIEILGDPTSRAITIVAPDGKLYFNFLDGIDVWGATIAQAKASLESQLANYVREKPQVSIILRAVESKRIWVLGRVQAPGVYPMTAPMTVLEAVSLAGGILSLTSFRDQEAAGIGQELSDLRRSFIIRHGKLLPVDFQRLLNEGDL